MTLAVTTPRPLSMALNTHRDIKKSLAYSCFADSCLFCLDVIGLIHTGIVTVILHFVTKGTRILA